MSASTTDLLANEQLKVYNDLLAKRRSTYDNDWQTLAQYFLPQDSVITQTKTEGVTGFTDQIYDTTGIQCAQTLMAGQYNWTTPPNQPWAEYTPPDRGDNSGGDDSTIWLGRASEKTMKGLARTNFYEIKAISDLGVGVFGTDLVLVEEEQTGAPNFIHCRIGTYVIEEDSHGIVDTVRREIKLTGRQAKAMFGKPTRAYPSQKLPDKMLDAMKDGKGSDRQFTFIHCIFPREDSRRIKGRMDGAQKPIASVYVSLDYRECCRVSGYDESPILCSRFARWGTDSPWGYGPAYLALPDARQLNYVEQYLDALAELHAYPRVLTSDAQDGDMDLRAGGVSVVNGDDAGKNLPREWMTVGEYKLGLELQEQKRQSIREAFFVPAFKLLNSDPLLDKKMTAYEISQRQAEQLQGFTPSFGRRIPEFINPCMRRVFAIYYRAGEFGPPPQELMADVGGGKLGLVMPDVQVTSRISDALRALKNRGIEEGMQFVAPLIQLGHPEVLDNLDIDKGVREYLRNAGVPADLLRKMTGTDSVQQIRMARAKAQQQMQATQMAEQMGKAAGSLGKAPQPMQDAASEALTGKAA